MAHRRPDRRGPASPAELGLTFAEALEQGGVLEQVARRTRETIEASNADAVAEARAHLRVITCDGCTAPKGCCGMVTGAHLHEGAVIAARLVDEGRDTAALRAALRAAAEGMEASAERPYRQPCALLGDDDRCTVYDVRPSICGAHLVSSPPRGCSEAPASAVSAVAGTRHRTLALATEQDFQAALGLVALDLPYRGALPRMVLLCLEAWDRRDFATFLAEHARPALHRYRWATART